MFTRATARLGKKGFTFGRGDRCPPVQARAAGTFTAAHVTV